MDTVPLTMLKTRPTWLPSTMVLLAPDPTKLSGIATVTFSVYVPVAMLMVSPAAAIGKAAPRVAQGVAGEAQLLASLPKGGGATYHAVV